ncbi:MAG: TIGR00266 family protein [Prochlorotrichaceae cyanobacterium]
MRYEIRQKPSFATLFLQLQPGEHLTAEAGAMASMDGAMQMVTAFSGGFFPALLKTFLGGESLFVNTFSNQSDRPLDLVITQAYVGDMIRLELKAGESLCLQPGAYIAHMGGVTMNVHWAGFKSWFSGEGLFKLKVQGPGLLFFGAYGGITERRVQGDFIVDTGHLVAYSPQLKMNIQLSSGLLGSLTSGEGFVNRMTGQGKIYLQSRSIGGLVNFLRPRLRS